MLTCSSLSFGEKRFISFCNPVASSCVRENYNCALMTKKTIDCSFLAKCIELKRTFSFEAKQSIFVEKFRRLLLQIYNVVSTWNTTWKEYLNSMLNYEVFHVYFDLSILNCHLIFYAVHSPNTFLKFFMRMEFFCGLKYITMRWLKQAFHEYFLDFKKRFLLSDMQRVTEVIRYTYLENNVTVKVVWLWKHFLLFAVYLERGHNRIVRCSITKTNNKNFILVLSCKNIMITKKICKWVEKSEKDTIFWTIVHTKFVI